MPSGRAHRLLSLFSGDYARADGLMPELRKLGWTEVVQMDNDGETGGGWAHDLLNDATFTKILADAKAGKFDAVMIAFPCSTFAITRFFDATNDEGGDRGPPVIRDIDFPDGLPEGQIDPKHVRELQASNELLKRTAAIAIAARQSPARATIIVENLSLIHI